MKLGWKNCGIPAYNLGRHLKRLGVGLAAPIQRRSHPSPVSHLAVLNALMQVSKDALCRATSMRTEPTWRTFFMHEAPDVHRIENWFADGFARLRAITHDASQVDLSSGRHPDITRTVTAISFILRILADYCAAQKLRLSVDTLQTARNAISGYARLVGELTPFQDSLGRAEYLTTVLLPLCLPSIHAQAVDPGYIYRVTTGELLDGLEPLAARVFIPNGRERTFVARVEAEFLADREQTRARLLQRAEQVAANSDDARDDTDFAMTRLALAAEAYVRRLINLAVEEEHPAATQSLRRYLPNIARIALREEPLQFEGILAETTPKNKPESHVYLLQFLAPYCLSMLNIVPQSKAQLEAHFAAVLAEDRQYADFPLELSRITRAWLAWFMLYEFQRTGIDLHLSDSPILTGAPHTAVFQAIQHLPMETSRQLKSDIARRTESLTEDLEKRAAVQRRVNHLLNS